MSGMNKSLPRAAIDDCVDDHLSVCLASNPAIAVSRVRQQFVTGPRVEPYKS